MPGPGRSIICACMMEQLGHGLGLGWWPVADHSGGFKCVLGLGSEDAVSCLDDASSMRDSDDGCIRTAHRCRTWECTWRDFRGPLLAPPAPKRDDADVYAGLRCVWYASVGMCLTSDENIWALGIWGLAAARC
jgi:hypothetical protein